MLQDYSITTQSHLGYFRSLIEHECTIDVDLKMNVTLSGKLKFIDNNMLMQLEMEHKQRQKLPQKFKNMGQNVFIRGSAFRKIGMPKIEKQIRALRQFTQKKQ